MKNSKLIVFLNQFSSDELKDLTQFIKMNSINRPNILIFLNYLKKHHPTFPPSKIQKEYIAEKLFPNEKNNLKKVKNLVHQLIQFIEKFLIIQELNAQEKTKDFLLLEALRRKKLDKYFFKKIDSIEQKWTKKTVPGFEHLHDCYRLKQMQLIHPNYYDESASAISPKIMIKHILEYATVASLYWFIGDYHTKRNVCYPNDKNLDDSLKLLSNLVFNEQDQVPQIKFLKQLLEITLNENFEDYPKIKKIFFDNIDLYSESEKTQLLSYLIQVCYRSYKKGNKNALEEHFALYKDALKRELIIENGFIAGYLFQNIVNIACAAKKIKWAEEFLLQYAHFIHLKEKKDTILLCKAIIYFENEEYTNVLNELAQLTTLQNSIYGIRTRSIQLRAYYKLGNYEETFYNLTQSFQKYLNIHKSLAQDIKENCCNFINFIKKMQKAKNNNFEDLTLLLKQIKDCQNTLHKNWLIQETELLQVSRLRQS